MNRLGLDRSPFGAPTPATGTSAWRQGGNGSYWTDGTQFFTPLINGSNRAQLTPDALGQGYSYAGLGADGTWGNQTLSLEDLMARPDQQGPQVASQFGTRGDGGYWGADYGPNWQGNVRTADLAAMGITDPAILAQFSGSGIFSNTAPEVTFNRDPAEGNFLMDSLGAFMQGPGLVIGAGMGISGLMNGALAGAATTAMDIPGYATNLANGSISGGSGVLTGVDPSWGANQQFFDNWDLLDPSNTNLQPDPFNTYQTPNINPNYQPTIGGANTGSMPQADPSGTNPNMTEGNLPNNVPGGGTPLTNTLPTGSTTAIQRVINALTGDGEVNPADLLSILGQVGPGVISAIGNNNTSNSLNDLAKDYMAMGQPYRDRLAATYTDPGAFLNSPEVQASLNLGTNALSRALSTQGNPAGSGRALTEIQNYATQNLYGQLGNERNRLANFGGLSSFNSAAPTTTAAAINSNGNVWSNLGSAFSNVMNPSQNLSLNDILRAAGINLNNGSVLP